MAVSDGIRHLLVDEFQDTSRRQHQLLSSLIAAWPERTGRTCFVVGDPMQSIYFFRDADAELFPRVKTLGLEIPHDEPLRFDFVPLKANFRTSPGLVERLNHDFAQIFADDDGSGVAFSSAQPARNADASSGPALSLHLDFVPRTGRGASADPDLVREKEAAQDRQIDEIVALIQSHQGNIEQARANGGKFRIAILGRAKKHLVPVAAVLREAQIPFRAVELEGLAARPEVLDALALTRALFNPEDRVAWLGVLRAPWCGLSLDDLHALTGAPELLTRPMPELLAERLPLLSETGRPAAARVLRALAEASTLRAAQPAASLGSWIEQVWLLLGGADCVDGTARANLDLLWSCLDRLPDGEPDLLGAGLNSALDKLTALPDPAASIDCGVQLMTIHKAKGLEFEVVIVPELQAANGRGVRKMLSWMERGLAQPDESGEITEFLIAPFQRKGEDRGNAKAWVDQAYRERESQEDRRILYVAATRAREELHFFARPACKAEGESFSLVEPAGSLLATAWPALAEEVRARFEDWKATRATAAPPEEQQIESIAASGESNLLIMPSPVRPTLLRRLPPDYRPAEAEAFSKGGAKSSVIDPVLMDCNTDRVPHPRDSFAFVARVGEHDANLLGRINNGVGTGPAQLYTRHEGGLLSRALGTAVHTLLEELARLRKNLEWDAARSALARFEPRIAAQIRGVGVSQLQAARLAAQALQLALDASHDSIGAWVLSPHANAASEAGWAGVVSGDLRTVHMDRVFTAGSTPCSEESDCWWIIDYKTAHADNIDPAKALPGLRALFAPQIEAYAKIMRNLHGTEARIFAGLYYPRMLLFDWWKL
jgi:ATP-dependent exoDNAse (exonuclease V) beta subunit